MPVVFTSLCFASCLIVAPLHYLMSIALTMKLLYITCFHADATALHESDSLE